MTRFGPIHWLILAAVIALLFGGYVRLAARTKSRRTRFLDGMNAPWAFGLIGAFLLDLAFLIQAYADLWPFEVDDQGVSVLLAGLGGAFLLASAVTALRSKKA